MLSAGALELMGQLKQQQQLTETMGGGVAGTMAMAGVMQLLAGGRKPEQKVASSPIPPAPQEPVPPQRLLRREQTAAVAPEMGQGEAGIERALLAINQRLAHLDAKLDSTLSHINTRFDSLNSRMQRLEGHLPGGGPSREPEQQFRPEDANELDLD